MKLQIFVTIFLSIWTQTSLQDFKGSSLSKLQKWHSPLFSSIKNYGTKPIFLKRIPGISSINPSTNAARILNNKNPLNLQQNGPYYSNHYIYEDNIDQHTIDQIKAGSVSNNKEIQLLNFHKDQFHSVGFNGNKEFHVLHLAKDRNHHVDDIKLHLSLLNAHKSAEFPEIDLEVNKHFGNFEVNLDGSKPLELDTSYLHAAKPSSHDIVKPLIQGYVSNHPSHNENLIQLADYLNENGHSGNDHILQHYNNFQDSPGSHHHTHGGILDLPHLANHPLEYDSGQASYDTPGAVDSYGHPATESSPHISNFNIHPEIPGSFSSGFGNGFKGNDLYQSEEYIHQLNEIGLQRKKRMDEYISTSITTEKVKIESENKDGIKHSNHKYN